MEVFKMSKQPSDSRDGKRLLTFTMILFVLAIGITIGTIISNRVDATGPGDSQLQIQTDGKPVAGGAVLALSKAFEEVSNRVEPCVVNINTEEIITNRRQNIPEIDPNDPEYEFFRRYFGPLFQMPEQQRRTSLGSGIIVDPKGYIITNNHVVERATKVKVYLAGGEEYTAKVIGTDPVADIAVIKISGKKDFSYAKIGNSKAMKVGDWVIAIGSPFGFEQTVTAGIISTTGRTFENRARYDAPDYSYLNDYLQTDAAINHGNSGGPLVNMNAEVVGINTFISSYSGGSTGVGFAVPSHIFTSVYNQILDKGKVARGWLGISMNTLPFTPAMAKFFGVPQSSGVLVTDLIDENNESSDTGPAAKGGIRPEDVIVEFNGAKMKSPQDLRIAVVNTVPGEKVKVKVIRHGQEKVFDVLIAERKFEEPEESRYTFDEKEEKPKPEIGLEFDNIPSDLAKATKISKGAYITSVKPGSLAEEAGMVGAEQTGAGDIIVAANGKPVTDRDDLLNIVNGVKSGQSVVFKFLRVSRTRIGQIVTSTFFTSVIKP